MPAHSVSRTLGLDAPWAFLSSFWRNKDAPEEPKKVLTGSKWHAVGRIIIHLIPMSVLVLLIAMNYSYLFIGPTFIQNPQANGYFTAGIQICAKLEELLCVASLSVIVLHALRHELLDRGIPIGLLGSGIWFSSLGAFWSPEFLGSLGWKWPSLRGIKDRLLRIWHPSSWRKPTLSSRARFYILLVVCGLIAATIGPASAVLMIPREQNMPAGGSNFYLYGTANQYYPDIVTSSSEPSYCAGQNSTEYAVCPSGGYNSLSRTLGAFDHRIWGQSHGYNFAPFRQAQGLSGNRAWNNLLIQSTQNLIPPVLNSVRGQYWADSGSVAIQPHAATIIMTQDLRDQWFDGSYDHSSIGTRQFRWTYDLETRGSAMSPWVRTKCTVAQNLTSDADTALFPRMNRTGPHVVTWARDGVPGQTYERSSIAGLDRSPSKQLRTQWMPLPIEEFGEVVRGYNTTGLLVELPWVGNSRAALGCAVSAAWHNSTVRSVRSSNYDAWSILLSAFDYEEHDDSPTSAVTNIPVTLDASWLQMLTPATTSDSVGPASSSLNTLESILENSYVSQIPGDIRSTNSQGHPICAPGKLDFDTLTDVEVWNSTSCNNVGLWFIEQIVAMVVVDGLSRFNSWRVLDLSSSSPRDWGSHPVPSFNRSGMLLNDEYRQDADRTLTQPDSVIGWITVYAVGFAYYPSTTADYLALFGVCVYLFLASCYIIFTFYGVSSRHKGTSSSWSSVTELLVLCQNSPPSQTSQLHNTSAGIDHLKTYSSVVKVRAVPPSNGEGPPQLRLVLDEDSNGSDGYSDYSSSTIGKSDSGEPDPKDVPLLNVTAAPSSSSTHLRVSPEPLPRKGLTKVTVNSKYG